MLFDQKKHWKAKQYQCITNDENNHLIQPTGPETEIVEIDPVQLVVDFVTLISEYAKCPHLRLWKAPLSYKGISDKKEQNRIYILNNHIYKEQETMKAALLAFVNKYGLFGIMEDNVMAYDYNRQNDDGSFTISAYPVTAYLSREDALQVRPVPYDQYIRPFFPGTPADEAIRLKGAERASQYAEYMEDILQNRRIMACAEYVAEIDKQNRSTLIIQGMNAVLSFSKDVPVYDLHCRSLIEYCHSMFFLNEIAGEHKTVRICQYKRCHRPHTNNSKYCCPECMIKANKRGNAQKKGDQNNG